MGVSNLFCMYIKNRKRIMVSQDFAESDLRWGSHQNHVEGNRHREGEAL